MMLFYENVKLALFSLKANKMRALLTMLGIIIGIASVIAIMTVGNSLTSSVTDSMASMGAANITIGIQQKEQEEESTEEGMHFGGPGRQKMPTEEDYLTKEMLENYCDTYADKILAISATENVGSGKITQGNLYANINLTGVSMGYFMANDLEITYGRLFSNQEFADGNSVALLSDKAAKNLFETEEQALGKQIQATIGNKSYSFVVVGIYPYEVSSMGFSSSAEQDITTNLLIPLLKAKECTHVEGYSDLTVVTQTEVDAEEFATLTENFFQTYYRNNRDFQVSAFSMSSIVESMTSMLSTITSAIAVIAGIALLVGGIGVMNIMLVSITERTREIGTRKALGAPNSSIRLQFIVESIIICLIGGVIGIILGILMGTVAAKVMGAPANPSIGSILLSLGFSMAIGIFFGYYPANKAAKMDPIEALRYE